MSKPAGPRLKKVVRRVPVKASVEMNAYSIIMDRLNSACEWAYNRAHKHTAKPDRDAILDNLDRELSLAVSELFRFSDD